MGEFCGKTKEGKWVCYKCMGLDHMFRDKNKYDIHINNISHKKNFGEEVKTKKELEQEELQQARDRIRYLEKQVEALRLKVKELEIEKQVEERVRAEQPKIQTVEVGIPQNEVVEVKPKKPKLKTITDPVKYLTNKFQEDDTIIDIEQDIDNMLDSNDFSKIKLGFKDLQRDIQSVFVYYTNRNNLFHINKNFYYYGEYKWRTIEIYELINRVFEYMRSIYKSDKIPYVIDMKQTFIEEIQSYILRCCSKEYEW
jgi:hypothetical protein